MRKLNKDQSFLIFLAILLTIIAYIIIIRNLPQNSSLSEPKTENHECYLKDTVIFEDKDITIRYKSFSNSGFKWGGGPCFSIYVQNDSHKHIRIQLVDTTINDYMVESMSVFNVLPNKKSNEVIGWINSDLEENNITKVKKIEFRICISDANNWDKIIAESNIITIKF